MEIVASKQTESLVDWLSPLIGDARALDRIIAAIDKPIHVTLDSILHHAALQTLESAWRSLHYLVLQSQACDNCFIQVLDVAKEVLRTDFEESLESSQSGLYFQLYTQEYDQPGGEPFAAVIADYSFDAKTPDILLLDEIAKVMTVAHCVFLGAIDHQFFNKKNIDEVNQIPDVDSYLERTEYLRWQNLRKSPQTRSLGLSFGEFRLRPLYHPHTNPVKQLTYCESPISPLWGKSNFLLAINLATSFHRFGWCVHIRGPKSGGLTPLPKLPQAPAYQLTPNLPVSSIVLDNLELVLSRQGFVPLSYFVRNSWACFYTANSIHNPILEFTHQQDSKQTQANARLPYTFLCCRLAHYLKIHHREAIGTKKSRGELERELNLWLDSLVSKMSNPDENVIAKHPLRAAKAQVTDVPDNPGKYHVDLDILPHFQIEGLDVHLTLVSQVTSSLS